MKIYILLIVPLLIINSAFANYLPSEYLGDESIQNKSATTLDNVTPFIDVVLKTESEALEKKEKTGTKFKLNTMATDFSLTKSGLFGLSALKANSTTTLFWGKKKKNTKEEKQVEKILEINGPVDEEELSVSAEELADTLYATGKVNNKKALAYNLKRAMSRANTTFGIINNNHYGQWKVSGLRLDLSVSASGMVTPFAKIGGSVRVWIEWKLNPKHSSNMITVSRSGKKLRRFVNTMMSDLSITTRDLKILNYKLNTVYVGLGQDIKRGFFGLGKSSIGFVGFVKFSHIPNPALTVGEKLANVEEDIIEENLPVIDDEVPSYDKSLGSILLPRKRFRNNLNKTLSFGKYMASRANNVKSSNWEIKKIRLVTALSKSGFLGLSTLSTKGVVILVFSKG